MTRALKTCFWNRFVLLFFIYLIGTNPVEAQEPCTIILDKKTENLYQDGITAFTRKNYNQAIQIMRAILAKEPDFADAYYVLGMAYFKRKESNFHEAEKNFLQVKALCPSYDPYLYYYLGEIAYSAEKFDATIGYLEQFLSDVDQIKSDEDYNRATDLLTYSRFYQKMIREPVPFHPVVVSGISTPENEYLPILSPDNQVAMFTREKKILPHRNSLLQTTGFKEKFMFSDKQDDGSFTEGEEMPDPFNIYDNEGGATLTADNRLLFYTVCRYNPADHYLNCDIYMSENIQGEWTSIKNAGKRINRPNTWESQPSITTDGSTLYFVSDRPGGYGGYDIYKTTRDTSGEWVTPVNTGPVINSAGNEKSPFIHPDGKTIYFSSDGWLGMGGYDVFYSRTDEHGIFCKPVNIGYPINSADDEVGFFVSTDGSSGFFASNKLDGIGGWDLYTFDLYPEARPERVLFIKGTVKDEFSLEPVKARIELKNVETKKISQIPLDTNTGNYVAIAPFYNDYIMTIKKEGYVYESKYISKMDSMFETPATVDMEIKPIELQHSYQINDIYFEFNSYDLMVESTVVLDQIIEFLQYNPTLRIQIQGHTDNIGNDEANLKLSENRAKSVFDYLIGKEIPASRLTYKGFGETDPIATNDTETGRAINRRTCFVITGK